MKYRFLVANLFGLLLVLSSCYQEHKKSNTSSDAPIFALMKRSAATTNTPEQRLRDATKAITLAKLKNDTISPYCYQSKVLLLNQFYPDSTYQFLHRYHRIARAGKNRASKAVSNGMLAEHHYYSNNSDSAFFYYEKSRKFHEELRDSIQVVYALLQMAEIYRQYGDYAALESATVEAQRFLNDPSDTLYNPTIYNNFGIALKNLGDPEGAIRYYQKVDVVTNDSIHKIIAIGNIAAVYKMTGKYDEVEKVLNPLVKSPTLDHNPKLKGRLLAIVGHSILLAKKPNAIAVLKESEAARKKAGDSLGLAATYNYLSEAYGRAAISTARKYAFRAYEIATNRRSIDDRLGALRNLTKYSSASEAARYYDIYFALDDSITGIRQSARNQFAKIRYDASIEKDENQVLRFDTAAKTLQIERSGYQIQLLILAMMLIVASAAIIHLVINKRHKKEKVNQVYMTETRIGKKVHDEFANDIYSTIAFTESENLSDDTKKEKLLQQLENLYSRSRDISRENSPIATDIRFAEQLQQLLSDYNNAPAKVITSGLSTIDWEKASEEQKVATYRVLHELLVNMKKHSRAALVAVRFEYDGVNIRISYSDNGVGMPIDKPEFKNGLLNVENRIEAISGTITFESAPDRGLRVTIVYKAKK